MNSDQSPQSHTSAKNEHETGHILQTESKFPRYVEVVRYFFMLGLTTFGGPLAVMAAMQRDLTYDGDHLDAVDPVDSVDRKQTGNSNVTSDRRWISKNEFNKVFSLIKAMPGAVAFQLAVYMGQVRAGRVGGLLAGFFYVLPSLCMMLVAASVFGATSDLDPRIAKLLLGFQAAALALIFWSLKGLIFPQRKNVTFWVLVVLAAIVVGFFPWLEPVVILGFGALLAVKMIVQKQKSLSLKNKFVFAIVPAALVLMAFALYFGSIQSASPAIASITPSLVPSAGDVEGTISSQANFDITLVALKAGGITFGSGLAIVPLLENDFVARLNMITHEQFMNALAFGQMTPGPMIVTITYIGFLISGLLGALLATFMVFLPSVIHMLTWFPLAVQKLGQQSWIQSFTVGTAAAVTGSVVITVLKLLPAWQNDFRQLGVLALGMIVFGVYQGPAWLAVLAIGFLRAVI